MVAKVRRAPSIWMFVLDKDDNIVGTKRVPTLLPDCVLCDDKLRKEYHDAMLAHYEDGRADPIKVIRKGRDGSAMVIAAKGFEIAPDTRPRFSIDIQKAAADGRKKIMADGVEAVTIEVTKLKNTGKTRDATFSGEILLEVGGDRELSFDFSNGVATKQYKTSTAGTLYFISAGKQKIVNPESLILAE